MDEGQLTDSTGKRVDFRNTLLVLTSNLGAGDARTQTATYSLHVFGYLRRHGQLCVAPRDIPLDSGLGCTERVCKRSHVNSNLP
eukprot:1978345-Pleurochrysis_carterae.AAC.3